MNGFPLAILDSTVIVADEVWREEWVLVLSAEREQVAAVPGMEQGQEPAEEARALVKESEE